MVVIVWPATAETGITQERVARPLLCGSAVFAIAMLSALLTAIVAALMLAEMVELMRFSPRARLRVTASDNWTVLAGVFDGNPLGNNPNNISGTNFNLHNGALYIGELQYAINQPSDGQMVGVPQSGLPGTYKIGVWYNNERFDDLSTDNTGLSLANPQSTGTAQSHQGNYSFYAVADQMIWRPDPDEPRSIGVFARVMGAPGDRNLVSVSANATSRRRQTRPPDEGMSDEGAGPFHPALGTVEARFEFGW